MLPCVNPLTVCLRTQITQNSHIHGQLCTSWGPPENRGRENPFILKQKTIISILSYLDQFVSQISAYLLALILHRAVPNKTPGFTLGKSLSLAAKLTDIEMENGAVCLCCCAECWEVKRTSFESDPGRFLLHLNVVVDEWRT